ncbi:ROK family protein [Arenibaculum pallidiluteum]|uniref:ROK family protein n=1 Tax=Arenibaculum pallidiluteum TaxID=2812559 RepID=UPI001F2B60F1|nr:ROK family protein [Arenibaculum pallidiluteum]
MNAFGIDIGGTAIKCGVVGADGTIHAFQRIPFDRTWSFDDLLGGIADICESLSRGLEHPPAAIGVATPGYSDPLTGVLLDGGGNVPPLRGRSIAQALSRQLRIPASVQNDGVAAAQGEAMFGAGRRLRRFVLATFGTGVGGAVVLDGEAIAGPNGEPPELGAIVPVASTPDGRGRMATLEQVASSGSLIEAYRARGGAATVGSAEELFGLAGAGDAEAAAVVDGACRCIAQVFGSLVNALGLEACLVGGGMSAAGAILTERIEAHMPDFTWPFLLSRSRIAVAELGNEAGMVGAAAMALARLEARAG